MAAGDTLDSAILKQIKKDKSALRDAFMLGIDTKKLQTLVKDEIRARWSGRLHASDRPEVTAGMSEDIKAQVQAQQKIWDAQTRIGDFVIKSFADSDTPSGDDNDNKSNKGGRGPKARREDIIDTSKGILLAFGGRRLPLLGKVLKATGPVGVVSTIAEAVVANAIERGNAALATDFAALASGLLTSEEMRGLENAIEKVGGTTADAHKLMELIAHFKYGPSLGRGFGPLKELMRFAGVNIDPSMSVEAIIQSIASGYKGQSPQIRAQMSQMAGIPIGAQKWLSQGGEEVIPQWRDETPATLANLVELGEETKKLSVEWKRLADSISPNLSWAIRTATHAVSGFRKRLDNPDSPESRLGENLSYIGKDLAYKGEILYKGLAWLTDKSVQGYIDLARMSEENLFTWGEGQYNPTKDLLKTAWDWIAENTRGIYGGERHVRHPPISFQDIPKLDSESTMAPWHYDSFSQPLDNTVIIDQTLNINAAKDLIDTVDGLNKAIQVWQSNVAHELQDTFEDNASFIMSMQYDTP